MFAAFILLVAFDLKALASGPFNHALFFAVDSVDGLGVLVRNPNFNRCLLDCFAFRVDALYKTLSVLIANFSILPRHLPS